MTHSIRQCYNTKNGEVKKMNWKKIEDDKIRHIWECPICKLKTEIPPTFYTDNGTPTCECGDDMEYQYSEIKESN